MAGSAAAALPGTGARDPRAESTAPTRSAARELPGSRLTSGERRLSRERGADPAGGALPWRRARLGRGTLCEARGRRGVRRAGPGRAEPAGAVGSLWDFPKANPSLGKVKERGPAVGAGRGAAGRPAAPRGLLGRCSERRSAAPAPAGRGGAGTRGSSRRRRTRLTGRACVAGEEARARGSSGARPREGSTDRRSPEAEEPLTKPAESPPGKKGAAKGSRPSSSEVEGRTCPGPGARGGAPGGGMQPAGFQDALGRCVPRTAGGVGARGGSGRVAGGCGARRRTAHSRPLGAPQQDPGRPRGSGVQPWTARGCRDCSVGGTEGLEGWAGCFPLFIRSANGPGVLDPCMCGRGGHKP